MSQATVRLPFPKISIMNSRLVPVLVAIGVGVTTSFYTFQPLLKQFEEETNGTFIRPGDEEKLKALTMTKKQTSTAQENA
ncbi:hypothetical protein EC973_000951 [Apophysomyces ossiformis]|uniref:Uncharacterized protein n=1 Tax=Apophysomyces ossiformis TaxID=679940 RepID=A0A8H7BUE9_9FUNG|nr:hypothetical protein EC973_000951 [Apophysomyces ossiformis]